MEKGQVADIEIWLDFVCPWCYIAETALSAVLARRRGLGGADPDIRFRSYILQPRAAVDPRPALERYCAAGMSRGQARMALAEIAAAGAAEGIRFDFDRGSSGPTLTAHRLLHTIQALGRDASNYVLAVFQGCFEAGKAISDPDHLIAAASGLLDPAAALAALTDPAHDAAIAADRAEVEAAGLVWIPHLRFADGRRVEGRLSRKELLQEWK